MTDPINLLRKLLQIRNNDVPFTDDTEIYELGIIDSFGLLDVILEVENECGQTFNAERLDMDGGISVGKIARAFVTT